MDVDVDALTSCGIGRTVNKLKKAESEDVQTLAKALVKKWKDLVAAQEPFFICVLVVARSIRAGVMPARRRGGHRRALPSLELTRALPTAGRTRRRLKRQHRPRRRPHRPRTRRPRKKLLRL